MRKLLLTSALVAGFASSAFAHAGPTVTLGGSLDTQLGVRSQKSGYDTDEPNSAATSTTKDKFHKFAIANDTKLHVKADGKAGNGLKYGGLVEIKADTSNDKFNHNTFNSNGRTTMVYAESMVGHLSAGSMTGVANSMSVSGASVARATGGVGGDWKHWINPAIFANGTTGSANNRLVSEQFIVVPTLPSNSDTGGEANAAKVSYMTPSYMGFKAGVTYIPDVEQHGSASLTHVVLKNRKTNTNAFALNGTDGDNTLGFKSVFSGGLHYAGKVSNVGLKASLLGETGDTKHNDTAGTQRNHDLRAWEIGGSANMSGFTLAASYGDHGKSGVSKTATGKKKSSYWTVGGSYEYGAMGASVTYMESKKGLGTQAKAKEHKNVSVGLDYKLAPGFMPYAEVSFFKLDEKTGVAATNGKNDGSVFLAGTKLSF